MNIISKMLSNSKYTGVVTHGDEIFRNIFPQISDEKLFDIVQHNTTKNACRTSHFKCPVEYNLSGKLFCMYCRAPLNGESGTSRHGQKYYYYKCQTRKNDKDSCKKQTIRRDDLES